MKLRPFSHSVAVLAAIAAMAPAAAVASPIAITSFSTAAALVSQLVDTTTGITIVSGTEAYAGATVAAGSFSGDGSILPFSSGIVLTTGFASDVPGPNSTDSISRA